MGDDFGQRLRAVREAAGLSRDDLAERLDAGNQKTIWRYETGRTDPRLSTVLRLAAALEVRPAELLPEGEA